MHANGTTKAMKDTAKALSTHVKDRTATPCPATHTFLCVLPDMHGNAFVVPSNHCRALDFVVVAGSFDVRLYRCRASGRCRASWRLCRASAPSRALRQYRAVIFVVHPPVVFAVRPAARSHDEGPGSTPASSQDAQV
jgi:hypothetical protein